MKGRTYSARVMRFRAGVYAARDILTPGCQVLLLRLSDSMNASGIVSIPRSALAAEFGCAPARITEWINDAKRHGFLSVVRRARPGVTAVYQGLVVGAKVREGVPPLEVRKTEPVTVREGVPLSGSQRYAQGGTQEGVQAATNGTDPSACASDDGSDEEHEGTDPASRLTEAGGQR